MGKIVKGLFGSDTAQTFVAAPEIPAPPAAVIDAPSVTADVATGSANISSEELVRRYRPTRGRSSRLGDSGTGLSV